MLTLKEVKEQLYKLEDIIALGNTLPLVAFPQLKAQLKNIEDAWINNDKDPGLLKPMLLVQRFIDTHQVDFDDKDERAIVRGFQRLKKSCPDLLHDYRIFNPRVK